MILKIAPCVGLHLMNVTLRMVPEQHDDRKDRAELNHDLEHFIECVRNVQLDKFVEQYHVTRAADRQPFRDALHDTEQECLEPFHILNHL